MESPENLLNYGFNNVKNEMKDSQGMSDRMTSSGGSLLDDTPSDSGVQLLDSESSELNESFISTNGFDLDNPINKKSNNNNSVCNMEDSFIKNSTGEQGEDGSAACEINSNDNLVHHDTENIVYRRRAKKTNKNHISAPKKRVSFHEDILKNTKTDNIHIEHGFITYKQYNIKKKMQNGRYSWCSEGDNEDFNENTRHVYRNACSDVLDYGKTDVYDNVQDNFIHYDNSGIFEYGPNKNDAAKQHFYKCSCSDSNSSLDSGSSQSDENNPQHKTSYVQSKSNSCDCIGISNANENNNMIITENCYYSEPSIEILDEFYSGEDQQTNNNKPKSVWSKDKKPKSSCLKKSKRHTDILLECNLNSKVKKFNVHPLSDMNNLIDNSKMIFGSLKNIFSIPLPERGVPEGSEDLQSVFECIPECDSVTTLNQKPRPFLSKSLDGGIKDISGDSNATKNYVHDVDEKLRRKNESDLFAPTRQNSRDFVLINNSTIECATTDDIASNDGNTSGCLEGETSKLEDIGPIEPFNNPNSDINPIYRNKFIINCESTVYEHTGVSFCYEEVQPPKYKVEEPMEINTLKEPSMVNPNNLSTKLSSFPLKQKISNIFKNLTDTTSIRAVAPPVEVINTNSQMPDLNQNLMDISFTSSCSDKESFISDATSSNMDQAFLPKNKLDMVKTVVESPRTKNNRHLQSPLRKKSLTIRHDRSRMSPDLFNNSLMINSSSAKNPLLYDEFDDILTIATDTEKTGDSDLVIVDYPIIITQQFSGGNTVESTRNHDTLINQSNNQLKPTAVQSKTSLINRFLRNVTQKKIADASVKKNTALVTKLKTEKKLFENLYIKNIKATTPKKEIMADFNAEIATEFEFNDRNNVTESCTLNGVGEISCSVFKGKSLNILRNQDEALMRVFKLYTGYSREGHMTPVLVFLTDKTLYVADLVRNALCNKFVLPYLDLDVILIGPFGNTVLLSNGSRDMQQVLLAGGSYPADRLVASLELCARKGGSSLPAVGQLTMDHLTPLQAFVRDNSSISINDCWMYYAVVNVPSSSLSSSTEPLGPNVRGPLMHRNINENGHVEQWQPGYFLLKAGVLYNFHDAVQKIPTWAITLPECQGARRLMNAGRPHCFELLLKSGILQLAAPDEYVASEWLQSLVQAASGLFEMQEKHTTLGCTLVMTNNHLITLREDFNAPLRRLNVSSSLKENSDPNMRSSFNTTSVLDSSSDISSNVSSQCTPIKNFDRRINSLVDHTSKIKLQSQLNVERSSTSMSSFYGKNSGIEILTCAAIDEMIAIKISDERDYWWCILEFSCQEVRENSDDLIVFFTTYVELQRFLTMLESLWYSRKVEHFPITLIGNDDFIADNCNRLFLDINKSWKPLLSAALGYTQ